MNNNTDDTLDFFSSKFTWTAVIMFFPLSDENFKNSACLNLSIFTQKYAHFQMGLLHKQKGRPIFLDVCSDKL